MLYTAFLSAEDKNDFYDDMAIQAMSKQDARETLAEHFKNSGAEAVLSNTSEEVYITTPDGKQLVYYGFDAD